MSETPTITVLRAIAMNFISLSVAVCHYQICRNSEVQTGGVIPEQGVRYRLSITPGDTKASCPYRFSTGDAGSPETLVLLRFQGSAFAAIILQRNPSAAPLQALP